jgi:SH3 domain protein
MLRFVFMLLVTIGSVQAAYITDKLLVGFYAKPEAKSQPVKVLPSSTPMEVLGTKDAFSKVRLGDGKEGWVKSIYISTEKPARAMLLELQAKSSTIQNKLRAAEKALKAAKAGAGATPPANSKAVEKLQQELAQAKKQLVTAGDALKKEQSETRRLVARLKKAGSNGSGSQSKQVRELKKKLSSSDAELKATLHEARLLQELLKKTDQTASQRIAALEAEVRKARQNQTSASSTALNQQNAIMKQRLQQLSKLLGQPLPEVQAAPATRAEPAPEPESTEQVTGEGGYGFGTWAFFLALLLIGGFVGGIAFKNHHIRRRYGGFKI